MTMPLDANKPAHSLRFILFFRSGRTTYLTSAKAWSYEHETLFQRKIQVHMWVCLEDNGPPTAICYTISLTLTIGAVVMYGTIHDV